MSSNKSDRIRGYAASVTAHVMWGFFPLYWSMLRDVGSIEILCHRIIWSWFALLVLLPYLLQSPSVASPAQPTLAPSPATLMRQPKVWLIYAIAGFFIAVNWGTFVWAITHEQVLESSLGYYLSPLLSVLLGVAVLGEKLSRLQWTAVGLAGAGVAVMAAGGVGVPWVALLLASSFGLYGLVKKRAALPAMLGLWLETSALLLPAIALLFALRTNYGLTPVHFNYSSFAWCLLVVGGIITVAPLALFSYALQRIELSVAGVLQYIGPTLQFVMGAFVLGEDISPYRAAGFGLVWIAIVFFLWGRSSQESLKGSVAFKAG